MYIVQLDKPVREDGQELYEVEGFRTSKGDSYIKLRRRHTNSLYIPYANIVAWWEKIMYRVRVESGVTIDGEVKQEFVCDDYTQFDTHDYIRFSFEDSGRLRIPLHNITSWEYIG